MQHVVIIYVLLLFTYNHRNHQTHRRQIELYVMFKELQKEPKKKKIKVQGLEIRVG